MEGVVENLTEFTTWAADKKFDKGWDRARKYVNGKKVEEDYRPVRRVRQLRNDAPSSSSSSSSSSSGQRLPVRSASHSRAPATNYQVRSPDSRGGVGPVPAELPPPSAPAPQSKAASLPGARRKQRSVLPPLQRDLTLDLDRDSDSVIARETEYERRVRESYRAETDDPHRNPASVLSVKHHWTLAKRSPASRRDSAMASGYNDDYNQPRRGGDNRARSAQGAKSKYYDDDDDSDYDDRSGRRYQGGRGYNDRGRDRDRDDWRDYDRVVEETERYRGPVSAGPLAPIDRAYKSNDPYGAGAVARRSDQSYVSRGTKTRGRDRDDRSYSRSRSRSGSRANGPENGVMGKVQDKVQETFDTSKRGLGFTAAGALAGVLAGREIGNRQSGQPRQRDMIIGAIVGGLGANAAENLYKNKSAASRDQFNAREQNDYCNYDGRSKMEGSRR